MEDPNEELAHLLRLAAEREEGVVALASLAATLAAYWRELVKEGLTEEAATDLTAALQHTMLTRDAGPSWAS
jgi:hypothetical protein